MNLRNGKFYDSYGCDSEDDDISYSEFKNGLCKQYKYGIFKLENVLTVTSKVHSSKFAASLYKQITPFLKNKTVVQIQIYGCGKLYRFQPAFQLTVALNLQNLYKRNFPKITVTCQEPKLDRKEKKYLRSKNIKILESEDFSYEPFYEILKNIRNSIKTRNSLNIQNSVFICYMIHGMHEMYDKFLEAHWTPELLSQIIIIGNSREFLRSPSKNVQKSYITTNFKRLKEFVKFSDSKPLKIGERFIKQCFSGICIYSISEKNAKKLIDKIH